MVGDTIKILGLAGSLRAASHLVPAGVEIGTFDGLGSLPFFDADVEAAGLPAGVADLRRAIAESDALLIARPEYNDGTSAVLENALDWASRGPIRILAGKPVPLMGAATGRGGARGGIDSVLRTMRRAGAQVIDQTVAIPFATEAVDDERGLADPLVRADVAELVAGLAARARTRADIAA